MVKSCEIDAGDAKQILIQRPSYSINLYGKMKHGSRLYGFSYISEITTKDSLQITIIKVPVCLPGHIPLSLPMQKEWGERGHPVL